MGADSSPLEERKTQEIKHVLTGRKTGFYEEWIKMTTSVPCVKMKRYIRFCRAIISRYKPRAMCIQINRTIVSIISAYIISRYTHRVIVFRYTHKAIISR